MSVDELNKGKWTAIEDKKLVEYVEAHGEGKWPMVAKAAGLKRCGKSCRLRWLNYLRPEVKRGKMSQDEEDLIIRLHKLLGNRWSLIAGRIPGRTDNDVKNYWNTNLSKKFGSLNKNDIKKLRLQPPSILTTQSHQSPIIQTAGDRLNSTPDMMTTNNCSSKPHKSSNDDWSWTFDEIQLAMDFNNNIGDFVLPAGKSQDHHQSTCNFQSFAYVSLLD